MKVIIPESIALANERGLDEAILLLLGLEKKCRVNNDFANLKEVCLHMVRLCRSKSDWAKLNSTLAVINKRFENKIKIPYCCYHIFRSSMQYDAIWYEVALYDQKSKVIICRRLWCNSIRTNMIWYDMIWYKIMLLWRKPNLYLLKLNSKNYSYGPQYWLHAVNDICLCSS